MIKKILTFVIILGATGLGGLFYVHFYMAQKVMASTDKIIKVEKGTGLNRFAKSLEDKGLIDNWQLFAKIGQLYGYQDKIKYGEYLISPGETYQGVYDKIISGENLRYEVTFVEGEHRFNYAQLIETKELGSAKTFLDLTTDQEFIRELLGEPLDSLEGYLFPETYHFSKNDDERTIIRTMVQRFLEVTKGFHWSKFGMNRQQMVTLASIIEKETGAGFERPLISSVFHNRLAKKMRLQTDPTIIYGILYETGQELKNIKKSDITRPTAYNTYVISGLPPGPIANPGEEALKAALSPQKTDYLYFVSRNDGTHVFTETYDQHLKAVKKFQLDATMRRGKSWRDLKNKKERL
ncbi:MAG: endolytic transglycosylase MltG [Bdellovibrionales bacterium]|nr:endolytic transglycosylase MltG [Bdellovibrionales bacterium]